VPNAPSDVDSASAAVRIPAAAPAVDVAPPVAAVAEIGGPAGPEPTRFGDWEKNGRCVDF
jgi:hypothetical protein